MKIKSEDVVVKPAFVPFRLELTFESQDEIDAFHSVFNCSHVVDVVRQYGMNDHNIREAMKERASPTRYDIHTKLIGAARRVNRI